MAKPALQVFALKEPKRISDFDKGVHKSFQFDLFYIVDVHSALTQF